MTGWGSSFWGGDPWGSGPSGSVPGPLITPLSPVDGAAGVGLTQPISIRITGDAGIAVAKIRVSVAGLLWMFGGSAINGAQVDITSNGHGVDLVLTPPAPYPNSSTQEVLVYAEDNLGQIAFATYSFTTGTGLRLLSVANPFEGMLLAYFNRPMRLDDAFFQIANWVVTPVSFGAKDLFIQKVSATAGQSNVAHLQYTGGGSIYLLTVHNLHAQDGSGIEPGYDHAEFEIDFPEQPQPLIRLYNSIFGPLGISQRVRTRRTVDDHVANRSIALALDEQFRLRMQQLDGTAGRDGRPGKLRF